MLYAGGTSQAPPLPETHCPKRPTPIGVTPAPQASTQVRYCRYSSLQRSEIPKYFVSDRFPKRFRSTLQNFYFIYLAMYTYRYASSHYHRVDMHPSSHEAHDKSNSDAENSSRVCSWKRNKPMDGHAYLYHIKHMIS
jgi:hypothetical protein